MKLLVVDGNSIVNRAFYGIRLLTTKDGRFTNAIYGFMNILLKLEEDYKPDAVAIAFDLPEPTFRHKKFDEYKAGRTGMPDELAQQMPVLKELLYNLGYKTVSKAGYEADDILGTLAGRSSGKDLCFIATGDRDALQLVNKNVQVLLATTQNKQPVTLVYDDQKIMDEYGVTPDGMIEIKALMGDSSDNIPGVAGIGKVTAGKLIQKYDTVDYIYDHFDEIDLTAGERRNLEKGKEMAYLSHELGTIHKEVPVDTDWSDYIKDNPKEESAAMLADLGLFNLMKRLDFTYEPEHTETKKQDKELAVKRPTDFSEIVKCKECYFLTQFTKEKTIKSYTAKCNGTIYFIDDEKLMNIFQKQVLENEAVKLYTSGSKELYAAGLIRDFHVTSMTMDIQLAGYLLNPGANNYKVERMVQEYSIPAYSIAGDGDEFTEKERTLFEETSALPSLCKELEKQTSENGQAKLLHEIEIPLAKVLASMEVAGFALDTEKLTEFGKMLSTRIDEMVTEIHELAGEEFNVNSPKQLGDILFGKLELPVRRKTKTGYSTSAEVLESLLDKHPIIPLVLEYRTVAKLNSTYCVGLLKQVKEDGRIHSTLNQTETRTGRISSTEPNMQNIPVREELGRQLRKFFHAEKGSQLVDADYSQIELRVLAHIADDDVIIEAFNSGQDIHATTAAQVFGMPLNMVTPLMRFKAKAVNFGIVYGIGAFSLAKDIDVSRAEAQQYIDDYLGHYAGVKTYLENVVEQAKENGYVETLYGRRRYLPELTSSNFNLRSFGERVAMNMPIQGTAADIIKIAMIRVDNRLKEENMKSRLIMQVHDELIVEAPEDEVEKARKIVKQEMENAAKLRVQLVADVHTGKTWYDAKE